MGTPTTLVVLALVPTALFAQGQGCGGQCGYGTECTEKGCDCKSGYGGKFTIQTHELILYCVRDCQLNSSSCPAKTICREQIPGDGIFRCYCSADAELSDNGECQGKREPARTKKPDSTKSPATSVIWKSTSTRSTASTTKSPTASGNVGETRTETPTMRSTELSTIEMSTRTETSTQGQRGGESTPMRSTELSTTEMSTRTETSTQGQRVGESTPMRSTELSTTEMSTITETSTQGQRGGESTLGVSEALKVGLVGGIGGAVFVAIVVFVVCVSFRKLKKRGYTAAPPDLNNRGGMNKTAANQSGQHYRDVTDLPLPELRGTENPAYHRVVLETELSDPDQSSNDLSTPTSNANKGDDTYDVSQLYSTLNKPKKADTTKNEAFGDLYSNVKMPEEKTKQRNQGKSSRIEEPGNTYDTPKYSKALATNRNYQNIQPGIPGSGNLNNAHRRVEYDTPYNTKAQMGPVSPSRVDDYDKLSLPRF